MTAAHDQADPAVADVGGESDLRADGRRYLVVFTLVGFSLTLALCLLGTQRSAVHGMEPIVGLPAEHMLRTHEWIVPKLYGKVFIIKPALPYWLTAACLYAVGQSEFSLRLPTALCGAVLGCAALWMLGRLVSPRCGLYAWLAMIASALFIEQGRIAGCDMPLAMGIGIAILCAGRNLALGERKLGVWLLAYLGLLVGFLSKGLPALGMYGPGLLVAALVSRQLRELFRWQHVAAALMALLLGVLYVYLAWRQEGSTVIHQQWDEVAIRGAMWNATAVIKTALKPVIILGLFLPGSVLLLVYATPVRRTLPAVPRRLAGVFGCFLAAGIGVWLVTPTFSSRYYLPLIMSFGVLAGVAAEAISPAAFRRDAIGVNALPASLPWLRRVWKTYHPGVVVTFWGLIIWAVYIGFIEPLLVARSMELRAVTHFAPRLPPGTELYVDSFAATRSREYAGHHVRFWNPNHPLPADTFLLLLQEKQRDEAFSREDLVIDILESDLVGDKWPWSLARVSRRAAGPPR